MSKDAVCWGRNTTPSCSVPGLPTASHNMKTTERGGWYLKGLDARNELRQGNVQVQQLTRAAKLIERTMERMNDGTPSRHLCHHA